MALAYARGLATAHQLLEREIANCFEHAKPWLGTRAIIEAQQVLADQRRKAVHHAAVARVRGAASGFGGRHGTTAHKGCELTEEDLLAGPEQLVAPGDRCP